MFFHENELQYPVEVEEPDPVFAKMLQEAIGGVEGEMRIALQYLFQAWSQPNTREKYRRMLLETATEEIGHVEILATMVAKNLENAPMDLKEEMMEDQAIQAAMSGSLPRHMLSAGGHALPVDANGFPFNGNYVVATGNLAADMYANVLAESSGRLLVTRLYEMTDDPGMKDTLAYLIARDTMHQNQWLTVIDELEDPLPVPGSFPQSEENQDYNYAFVSTLRERMEEPPEDFPFVEGESHDGHGEYSFEHQPGGGEFDIEPGNVKTYNQPEAE